MPLRRNVSSLNKLCIDALTKFIVRQLDPEYVLQLHSRNHEPLIKFLSKKEALFKLKHKKLKQREKGSNCLQSLLPFCRKERKESKCNKESVSIGKKESVSVGKKESLSNGENVTHDSTCISILHDESLEHPVNVVRKYLLNLTRELTACSHCYLQESLFNTILEPLSILYQKSKCEEMRVIVREIVPLFINSSLREFVFSRFRMFSEDAMFEVLYDRLSEAKSLERLVIDRSCYWYGNTVLNISKLIPKMPNLHTLHLHYLCSGEMLKDVPENCSQLRELSIKGSLEMSDKDVPILIQFSELETLDISGTGITGMGCKQLVRAMRNLMWLTHCPFNCNTDNLIFESRSDLFDYIKNQLQKQPALLLLSEAEAARESVDVAGSSEDAVANLSKNEKEENNIAILESSRSLNLKFFWLFNATTEELYLTHLCPSLVHLKLDFILQDMPTLPSLEAITQLPNLSELSLNILDLCPTSFVSSIIEVSTQITVLNLHIKNEWFFVAPLVNVISQLCHNLTHLKMEGDYKNFHSLNESDNRLDFAIPPEGLSKLQVAKISGCVTNLRIMHLLTQAPNLHALHLDGDLENLNDDAFIDAINRNLFQDLEELWLNVSSGITFNCIQRLLESNNVLRKIGRLCLMSSASKEGYMDLLGYTRKHNLATELIWVIDQRDFIREPVRDSDRI